MSFWEKLTGKKSQKSTHNLHRELDNEASNLMVQIRELQQKIDSGEMDPNLQKNVERMKEELQGLREKQSLLMEKERHDEENADEKMAA
ncbi:MAG: hypothetical protein WD898_01840 [Candidatus Paceibacterota bacterium]